mmetsp:Transcript_3313/g.10399  ORF Transcript_3313/g.10399 Transcript_3313/m.10399 type:complete len:367 (+) Transcript_3313:645-1745(+)
MHRRHAVLTAQLLLCRPRLLVGKQVDLRLALQRGLSTIRLGQHPFGSHVRRHAHRMAHLERRWIRSSQNLRLLERSHARDMDKVVRMQCLPPQIPRDLERRCLPVRVRHHVHAVRQQVGTHGAPGQLLGPQRRQRAEQGVRVLLLEHLGVGAELGREHALRVAKHLSRVLARCRAAPLHHAHHRRHALRLDRGHEHGALRIHQPLDPGSHGCDHQQHVGDLGHIQRTNHIARCGQQAQPAALLPERSQDRRSEEAILAQRRSVHRIARQRGQGLSDSDRVHLVRQREDAHHLGVRSAGTQPALRADRFHRLPPTLHSLLLALRFGRMGVRGLQVHRLLHASTVAARHSSLAALGPLVRLIHLLKPC